MIAEPIAKPIAEPIAKTTAQSIDTGSGPTGGIGIMSVGSTFQVG